MTIKKSKIKAQNSKPQLKTLKLFFCHPERSEGSPNRMPNDKFLMINQASMTNNK